VALPPNTDMLLPTLLEGRWLLSEDENAMVINAEVRDLEPDVGVGDDVVLKIGERESTWRVVGVVRGVLAGPRRTRATTTSPRWCGPWGGPPASR